MLDSDADPNGVAELLEWMRAMNGKVRIMSSVCTGAAVLATCGFLDGLPAATNHGAFDWVATRRTKSAVGSRVRDGSTPASTRQPSAGVMSRGRQHR